ncbi:hypothetical protein VMCG_06414 [Cytospora schulzeri]|uniref:ribonuclease H n=1 Tax=Cytospora schulzeri TaxID=448051 RepID=A0A423W808_9PEZI|nr:hypothetical protein VMCG_06414 [Valsa malicola]
MASGWNYLLPDSDSDGEGTYDPVTLPDGRLACYRHLNITCYKCCVDYSFMEAHSSDEEEADDDSGEVQEGGDDSAQPQSPVIQFSGFFMERTSTATQTSWPYGLEVLSRGIPHDPLGSQVRRGTGRIIPTKVTLPSPTSTPDSIFQGRATYADLTRFVHRQEPQTFLIYTDGACINNGQPNPKAGWAFVHGPRAQGDSSNHAARTVAFRLEQKGPFGDVGGQTSNRAEMRAVIAALRFRQWAGEGCKVLVIATDSEYVVEGATGWVRGWIRKGWRTRSGDAVKNKDLWECLLGEVERYHNWGMNIEFWRIPREWNTIADAAAKAAAREDEIGVFNDCKGLCI